YQGDANVNSGLDIDDMDFDANTGESVYYISFHSNIEEIKNMPVSKLSKSDNFENELDSVFLCAQFLLQQLDCTKIEEVWKVSKVTRQDINHVVFCLTNRSYSCICLLQQKQRLWIPKMYQDDVIIEPDYYGNIWKLVHTAVDKYVIHQDHTFVEIIKSYLTSINLREEENSNQQVNYSENEESNNENTFPNISIRNLRKVATRGRPKLSSHYNNNQNQHLRNKPLLDEKRCQNYCSYCKKIGHNVATCSKKAEDQQI
ncbi:5052_t:CDS:2, partial [Gigaspora rosea]